MDRNYKTQDIGKQPRSSEITPEQVYLQRRQFLGISAAALGLALAPPLHAKDKLPRKLSFSPAVPGENFHTEEQQTPYKDARRYNNFYEFGSGKGDPARHAKNFPAAPWNLEIAGQAEVTGVFTLEDILKPHPLEERIYRLRCVEAWSMVIPWVGFPLADLIKRFKPTSKARYLRFTTLYDPKQMPGQRARFGAIPWPYVEGLRMDEALHPLSFIATGMYGRALPGQNGAPLRLVMPWKYGFKSIKSIVKIEFLNRQPNTTWADQGPSEYGFYANVNPKVDHPRWSQASERRLPSSLFRPNRIPTRMFNGYAEQVASLYSKMDLRRYF